MPFFFRKLGKMSQNLLSAAVVIGALRYILWHHVLCQIMSKHLIVIVSLASINKIF